MSKIPYIHYQKDQKSLIHTYFIALIPLLFFGFYKNGILLYQNDLITFQDIFIPLYFPLISILIGFLIGVIQKTSKKEMILISLILSCTVSMNTNVLIYSLVLFATLFITSIMSRKYAFNYISLTRIVLILALIFNSYSYLNVAEKIDAFNYNWSDKFLGYANGGIFTSSTFFVIISFLILAFNKFYKKIIPITSSLSYVLILALVFIITKDTTYLNNILNGTTYFAFVMFATDPYTPNTKKGMMIYGVLIGIITSVLSLVIPMEASFISIFICSLTIPLINKFLLKNVYNQ